MIDPTNRNTALASAFVEELARSGLGRAVISPGSRSTPLAVALFRHPDIEASIVVDERSAGFLAVGAAQAAGAPVALLCTSGTAAANYHPAVAEADLSGLPLILLTADRPPELREIGAGQTIDQIQLYGAAVRWFFEIGTHEADDDGLLHMRSTACRAYATAAGDPRPGPVHLNFAWREPLAPVEVPDQVTATGRLALAGRVDGPLNRVSGTASLPDPTAAEEVADLVAACSTGLILVGRQTDPGLRHAVTDLATQTRFPVLAEPTSQLRLGHHDLGNLIWAYDEVLTDPAPDLRPQLVLRFGEFPTSKRLRQWIAGSQNTVQIAAPGIYAWNEPSRIASLILRGDPAANAAAITEHLERRLPEGRETQDGGRRSAFLEAWRLAQRNSASAQLERIRSLGGLSAAAIHHTLSACYRDGDLVYTNSSMAIRDQERYLTPSSADVLFLANRGANGIDGLIASGIGAALATGRPTTIITGDVAFLHDLGSLASWRLAPGPLRILLINDGGGTIFNHLPQAESMPPQEFTTLMTTPPQIEPKRAAALFDLPYHRLEATADLPALLSGGSCLIEAPITPQL